MTCITLVRHGQSEWNAVGRWQGWADPPLSALGREQARQAVDVVGSVDVVVTSDLRRALDTAAIIAAGVGAGRPVVLASLRERDVGEWTGLTRVEIARRWPGALSGPLPEPPGGETTAQLLERVLAAMAEVATTYDGLRVLAVSHGGFIRALERHLGVDSAPLPNLGGVDVTIDAGGTAVGPRRLLLDPDEVLVTVPRQL
ncbi:MAG: histidine phosphatase family protein [Actinomycetota bacterium]|nr:histidine phosphatase family protein [Actinomycetota bacterium]